MGQEIIGIRLNGVDYDYEDESTKAIADANAVSIGDLEELETEDKTNLVGAINEALNSGGVPREEIGELTDLTTTTKTNIVAAINEVDGHADDNAEAIGTLTDLTTTAKTDLVSAINEVDGHADDNADAIGTLENLTTTAKTDLVSAINEVDGHADDNADAIGTLENLETTAKTDLVSAINEVNSKKIEIALTDLSSFYTVKSGSGVSPDSIIGKVQLSPSMGYFTLNVAANYKNSVGRLVSFRLRAPASEEFYNALKQVFGSKIEDTQTISFINASTGVFIRVLGSTAQDIIFGTASLNIKKLSATTAQSDISFSGSVGVCMVSGTQDSSIGTNQVTVFY
jgi:hypothetical protein